MKTAELVESLIAEQREEDQRLDVPPPSIDIREPAVQQEVATATVTELVELLEVNHPQQEMRWNGDAGQMMPYGRPPPPFEPRRHPTVKKLLRNIWRLREQQARK